MVGTLVWLPKRIAEANNPYPFAPHSPPADYKRLLVANSALQRRRNGCNVKPGVVKFARLFGDLHDKVVNRGNGGPLP